VLCRFFEIFTDEVTVLEMSEKDLEAAMKCKKFISTFKVIQKFTVDFKSMQWVHPLELCGISQYSMDVWKIFWVGDWETCKPTSHDLKMYVDWLTHLKSSGISSLTRQ